jgi:hypothetical protein
MVMGQKPIAVSVNGGIAIVVVVVSVFVPEITSRVVVNFGSVIVVVDPSCEGGMTIVHGGKQETVEAPPLDQIVVGA